jgi:hypothetical protein
MRQPCAREGLTSGSRDLSRLSWPKEPSRKAMLSSWRQHLLLAGPMLGFVSGAIQYMLSGSSPRAAVRSTGQTIEQARSWHGRYLDSYYITPGQHILEQCLSAIVGLWMIGVIGGLIVTGMRINASRRKN